MAWTPMTDRKSKREEWLCLVEKMFVSFFFARALSGETHFWSNVKSLDIDYTFTTVPP